MAAIVEAEAVDHRAIALQPEDPRLRIAGLRLRRQRTDFGETKAERQQASGTSAFLS